MALMVYGTYANWLATQLAAIWGAGRKFAPAAAGGHVASVAKEGLVNFLMAWQSDGYHRCRDTPRKEAAHDIVFARFEVRC